MNEVLAELDLELKGYFVGNKLEELMNKLNETTDEDLQFILDENWVIMKKYYEGGNMELIFQHIKFVAYTCYLVEYSNQRGLLEEETFSGMIAIYEDIYNQKTNN